MLCDSAEGSGLIVEADGEKGILMTGIAVGVVSNSDAVLEANLQRSPMIASGDIPLHVKTGARSASTAYNSLLNEIDAEYVVLAHQDVFFPLGWEKLLKARIARLSEVDPHWALLGPYGVGFDATGYGPVWATSLGRIVGSVSIEPVRVQSYDELVIIVRKETGVRFDAELPHFHLYGTDIVQIAGAAGLHAYVASLPVIHNDRFHMQLDEHFAAGYHYVRKKWRQQLPFRTPILKVSSHGLHLARARWHNRQSRRFRQGMAVSAEIDPRVYAGHCGWNDLTPQSQPSL